MQRLVILLACLILPAFAQTPPPRTAQPNDYAWRWALSTSGTASAYLLRLTPEIYASLNGGTLDDLAIFNAAGQRLPLGPLPGWAMPTEQLTEQPAQWSTQYFAPLPKAKVKRPKQDSPVKIEVESATGTRIKVETGNNQQNIETPEYPESSIATLEQLAERGPPLRLNENGRARLLYPNLTATLTANGDPDIVVEELRIHWVSDVAPHGYWRISNIDENGHRVSAEQTSILDNGIALEGHAKLTAPGVPGRTLILEAFNVDKSFTIRNIRSYTRNRTQFAYQEWMTANRSDEQSKTPGEFLYKLTGPLRITRAQISLDAPGTISRLSLYTRNSNKQPWQIAATDEVYQLQFGNTWLESGLLALNTDRTHELRITSEPPLIAAPTIKLAYPADYLVFLAQGAPPYTLYAGSAKSIRQESSALIEQLLRKARSELGPHWLPPTVTAGIRDTAGGSEALAPPVPQRNWTSWLLWVLLIAGAAVVIAMVVTLLRGGTTAPR